MTSSSGRSSAGLGHSAVKVTFDQAHSEGCFGYEKALARVPRKSRSNFRGLLTILRVDSGTNAEQSGDTSSNLHAYAHSEARN